MKIAILGANGFIGQYLSKYFCGSDNELILFSRSISPELEDLNCFDNVTLIKGDYNDLQILTAVIKDCDVVYHLIAASIPLTSWDSPLLEIESNVIPSVKLFELCVENLVKKIVFISSAGTVYGESLEQADEETKVKPFSPYGISKVTIESYLEYFRRKSSINYDIYRLSNPYGLGLNKKGFGVINTWLESIKNNKPITIFGDGTAVKDFIYIDDVVNIIASSVDRDLNSSMILNACSGNSISLLELLDVLFETTKNRVEVNLIESNKSDNQQVHLSNKKLTSLFKKDDFVSLSDGILKIWNKLSEH